MCSIAAAISDTNTTEVSKLVCDLLSNMTYRGYDSIGISASDGITMTTRKTLGTDFDQISINTPKKTAIGQTRWATHGANTVKNANPQQYNNATVVMNGIISNYDNLKQPYFKTENDTEAAAYIVNQTQFDMQKTASILEGRYTLMALNSGGNLGFIRGGPSLVTGMYNHTSRCLASDIHALASNDITKLAVIPIGTFGYVSDMQINVFDIKTGKPVKLKYEDVPPVSNAFMSNNKKPIKENITEIELEQAKKLDNFDYNMITVASKTIHDKNKKILFTGSGSSYHMACLGAHLLQGSIAKPACEFFNDCGNTNKHDIIVAISQSGESGDILHAIESSRHASRKIITITNNSYSSLADISDIVIEMGCGPEHGVAATKSVIATVMILQKMLGVASQSYQYQKKIPNLEDAASLVAKSSDVYVLGSGVNHIIAMEGALKLKELSYLHAESCYAGEFKHGPLAVLEPSTAIMIIDPDGVHADLADEIKARGGRTILIGMNKAYETDVFVKLNHHNSITEAILAVQSLAIKVARLLDRPVDRPRHLAKCVTV